MKRFWDRVNKNGPIPIHLPELGNCWVWTRIKNPKGYGTFNPGYNKVLAHRFSWELENGAIPDKLCVLHKCDNASCVRPEHLFLGTREINNADMIDKGRKRTNLNILGEVEVIEIRNKSKNGVQGITLALEYKVSRGLISFNY